VTLSNRQLVTAIIALLVLRLITAFLIELTPQEAYYWNYAIHPSLSYFDHPPVVAWVIRAGYFVRTLARCPGVMCTARSATVCGFTIDSRMLTTPATRLTSSPSRR
jgi:4-amino-4-deoxy-L-arabinose transferase-like glycosyltransferase